MDTEEMKKQEVQASGPELQERQKIEHPDRLLKSSLSGLESFGGFQMIKGLIKGVENMDPRKKAVKDIFLTESTYADTRRKLKNELEVWIQLLEGPATNPVEIIEACTEQRDKAEENLQTNLATIHEEIRKLEVAYRTLDSFFANAGQGRVECLTLMNVNKQELKTSDSEDTLAICDELAKHYDLLSLKNNYSLLVIPGQFGENDSLATTIRMWAKTAYKNKVIMVTDFRDVPEYPILKELLEQSNLQGQDAYLANLIMTCNYLFGRKRSEQADEDDDLYIPGSAALAGRMSDTEEIVISQGVAGTKYGTLNNVKGARLSLRKAEIASLIDLGIIPMVESDGRTMAFSNRSLYNGATLGLQEYPIVRVFDWIGKVFQHFFNAKAFENWDSKVKKELQDAIHAFLSGYKGPGELFESYTLKKLEQDPVTKDIHVEVDIKPFFAAKNFFIELKGHNVDNTTEWEQNVQ